MTEPTRPRVLMYSTPDCGDCHRSKALLKRLGIPYGEINVENDPAATAEVMRLNQGRRTLPTIVIGGTTVLAEPSDRELAAALGVKP